MLTARLLELLEMLQVGNCVPASVLADRLAVEPRTIRRDIDRLRELGYVVRAVRGRNFGYVLDRGIRVPPLLLDDDEALAVMLGLLSVEHAGLRGAVPAANRAGARIRRLLPAEVRDRVDALADALDIMHDPRGDSSEAGATAQTILALAAARRQRRRVRLRYRDREGVRTDRDLDPYGLVLHRGRWYLAGHDHLRGEDRTLRVDRIEAVLVSTEPAETMAGSDPQSLVGRALAFGGWEHEVEVILHAPIEEVQRRLGHASGEVTGEDGRVLWRLRVDRIDGMAQALAGLGWPFEVVRPDQLRAAVHALGERLLEV
jgi:predicted DNA-binding transcriptional regulator YafY